MRVQKIEEFIEGGVPQFEILEEHSNEWVSDLIISVKRINDGQEFTLGDIVHFKGKLYNIYTFEPDLVNCVLMVDGIFTVEDIERFQKSSIIETFDYENSVIPINDIVMSKDNESWLFFNTENFKPN